MLTGSPDMLTGSLDTLTGPISIRTISASRRGPRGRVSVHEQPLGAVALANVVLAERGEVVVGGLVDLLQVVEQQDQGRDQHDARLADRGDVAGERLDQ